MKSQLLKTLETWPIQPKQNQKPQERQMSTSSTMLSTPEFILKSLIFLLHRNNPLPTHYFSFCFSILFFYTSLFAVFIYLSSILFCLTFKKIFYYLFTVILFCLQIPFITGQPFSFLFVCSFFSLSTFVLYNGHLILELPSLF